MRNPRESGYSLAEMLTVVAIIGTLALVTIPAFMTYMQSNKMKSALRQFTGDLRAARQRSISQGQQLVLTFSTGATARTYEIFQGNAPMNSTSWSRGTLPANLQAARNLEDVVYFPTASSTTPQTFTDEVDCSSVPCSTTPATDNKLDVIFFPDGRVQLPAGLRVGAITLKTDMRIPTPQYAVTVSPTGRVLAAAETAFANLGSPSEGTVMFCTDCKIGNPCTAGGSGALARASNSAWACN